MKKIRIVSLMAATALMLSACGGGAGSSAEGSKESKPAATHGVSAVKPADYLHASYDELKEGGTYTFAMVEVPPQMNPFQQDGTLYTTQLWYYFNPQLALFADDGTWSFNPAYFDDVTEEEKDGNTVVTFKIKEEATYNDGTPIDYRAFENTWKQNNGTDEAYLASSTDGYEQIKSVTKGASDKEVIVTFDGIYAWWQGLFNLVMHPAINSPELYESYYTSNSVEDYNKYGAGPYIIESWDTTAGKVTFVPNPKWWGNKAKLERVTGIVMEDQASLNAFTNGEIDAVVASSAERLNRVKDLPNVTKYTAMAPSNFLLTLNSESEMLKDIEVRKAIFEGIDRSAIAKVLFQGLDYSEDAPGSFVMFETQPGYEDNFSKAVTFDAKAAAEGLEKAGWKAGADGIREKDGQKLSVIYPLLGDSNTRKAVAQVMQQNLKAIGIDMQIKERPTSDFSKIIQEKDFDLFMMGFNSSDPFGVAYFGQIYGSDSGLNLSGTGTEELDKKIEELKKISDPEEQIKEANKLEVEAFKTYGLMPVYNGPNIVFTKEGLANVGAPGFALIPRENIGWKK